MATKNNMKLINNAINELICCYSCKEGTDGILKEINYDSNGRLEISIIITYTNLIFDTDEYFGFVRKLEEISKKTNVKIWFDLIDSCEYGLLGINYMQCGQANSCGILVDGEILFDRTGKYKNLQEIAKRTIVPNGLRRVRVPQKHSGVSRVS